MKKRLSTSAGRSHFEYEGSVSEGTTIYYGNERKSVITKEKYGALLYHFKGTTVKLGTSRCNPQKDSLGEWINNNIQHRSLASYIVPILISEGYAKIGYEQGTVTFK